MVQIKDSVLRDSGSCPAFPRIATRRASPRCRVAGPVWWFGPMVTVREGCPHRVFDTGQRRRLSTTCQQLVKSACMSLIFAGLSALQKKCGKIRKIGLTFSKVVQRSRIFGTIQCASSNRGGGICRGFPAESLLRP